MRFLGIFSEFSWIFQTPKLDQEIQNALLEYLLGSYGDQVINLYYRLKGNLKVPWNIL